MNPTPPPDQEVDLSKYIEKREEVQPVIVQPTRRRLNIPTRVIVIIGIFLLLVIVQIFVWLYFRIPDPEFKQPATVRTQSTPPPKTNSR